LPRDETTEPEPADQESEFELDNDGTNRATACLKEQHYKSYFLSGVAAGTRRKRRQGSTLHGVAEEFAKRSHMTVNLRSKEHMSKMQWLQAMKKFDEQKQAKEELLMQSRIEVERHNIEAAKYERLFKKAQYFAFCKDNDIN
jgi:predicted DNA-binding protein (MmcQ/YjbR family)